MVDSGAFKILCFFVIKGVLVPSYEKVHFYFLLKYATIDQEAYDFLSVFPHIGIAFGSAIYLRYLYTFTARRMIILSFAI